MTTFTWLGIQFGHNSFVCQSDGVCVCDNDAKGSGNGTTRYSSLEYVEIVNFGGTTFLEIFNSYFFLPLILLLKIKMTLYTSLIVNDLFLNLGFLCREAQENREIRSLH